MNSTGAASSIDDIDARPGSTTSLLRTVIATYLRPLGGWIGTAALIRLLEDAGVPAPRTRTAVVRVKAKGLLRSEARDGVPGYAVAEDAHPMLVRAHQRIHHPRWMRLGDRWCLISFSIPEELRDVRHQLRRRLRYIGCGTVSAALWIVSEYLVDEVEEILEELGVREHCALFLADEVRGVDDLPAAVRRWWDLTELGTLHREFLDRHAEEIRSRPATLASATAFGLWTRALDRWRIIPYNDPGLPAELLPADWPGLRATPLFFTVRDEVAPLAAEHVRAVTGRPGPLPDHFEECAHVAVPRTA
ncbi:PaaX family transcriptional regulator [Kineococcus sp. SYSU DK003]|uniref:PaaX family transcriptional regulator n=1 Tax=Kineococcus sp. SYSU DK003 TaxID=3383124 RepID=UPI003D7EA15F